MYTELKQRKVVVQRKRTRATESSHPDEVSGVVCLDPFYLSKYFHLFILIYWSIFFFEL